MPSLSTNLLKRLNTALVRCDQFQNGHQLQSLFVDSRIARWGGGLPQTSSIKDRITQTINYLLPKYNVRNENGLVLFLQVLADQYDEQDQLTPLLQALAVEVSETLSNTISTSPANKPEPSSQTWELSFEQLAELTTALLACPSMHNRHQRDTVVSHLPQEIAAAIQRKENDKFDVMEIVTTCSYHSDGLSKLLQIISFFEGQSLPVLQLQQTVQRVLPNVTL